MFKYRESRLTNFNVFEHLCFSLHFDYNKSENLNISVFMPFWAQGPSRSRWSKHHGFWMSTTSNK